MKGADAEQEGSACTPFLPAFPCQPWPPHFCLEVTGTQGPRMTAATGYESGSMGLEPLRPGCVFWPFSVCQFLTAKLTSRDGTVFNS